MSAQAAEKMMALPVVDISVVAEAAV